MTDEDNDKKEKGEEEKGEEEKEPRRYDASDRDTDDQVGIDTMLCVVLSTCMRWKIFMNFIEVHIAMFNGDA